MKDRYNYGRIKVQGHRKKPHAIAKFVGGKVFKVKRGVYWTFYLLHVLTILKITRFILLTCSSIWDLGNLTIAKSHMNYHHSYACFPYFLFSQLFSRAHQFLTLMIFIQHMSFFPPKQTDEQEVITFLLTTEIIPLCLRIMEAGSELSKTVSMITVSPVTPRRPHTIAHICFCPS